MPKKAKKIRDGLDNAKDVSGRVKILLAVGYKDGMIYVKKVDKDLFFWDAVWQGQLYSNYMVITPKKGETELSEVMNGQVAEMCYAGAAATIDELRGDEMSEKDKAAVALMESKRETVEAADKKVKN